MNKNDKLIAIIGVVILIIASFGIYTWTPDVTSQQLSSIDDFFVCVQQEIKLCRAKSSKIVL